MRNWKVCLIAGLGQVDWGSMWVDDLFFNISFTLFDILKSVITHIHTYILKYIFIFFLQHLDNKKYFPGVTDIFYHLLRPSWSHLSPETLAIWSGTAMAEGLSSAWVDWLLSLQQFSASPYRSTLSHLPPALSFCPHILSGLGTAGRRKSASLTAETSTRTESC